MVVQVALIEIMDANKGEMIRTKPEIEVQSYVQSIKAPTEPNIKNRPRR